MTYHVNLKLSTWNHVLSNHGLQPNGPIQAFFTNELFRTSAPYTPFRSGVLLDTAIVKPSYIEYLTPYARYLWKGKLMVDPITKKGAFYDPMYGFWSRPGVQKELTDRPLQFQGAPLRGSKWVERAWIDNKQSIINSTQRFVDTGGGQK